MIHTFLPVVVTTNEKEHRVAYVNVAHIKLIDKEEGKAYIVGDDSGYYRLAPGWKLESNQLMIGYRA